MNARSTAAVAIMLMALAGGSACHHSQAAAEPSGPAVPKGEVWLTPQQVAEAKIETMLLDERDLDDTILTSGAISLEPKRTGHVFSPVTGRVIDIKVDLGQRVKKGQSLAVINSPDVGNAVSDEKKAQADLIAAEHDRTRKKRLFEDKALSAGDLEASEDNYRKAVAELQRARQKVNLLGSGAFDAVSQTYTLPSPIDGEVLMMNINAGVEVQGQYSGGTQQELFTLGEVDKVWLLGDLYEMDLARVRLGAPATVTVAAYPAHPFVGKVDLIQGMFDPGTRTAKVRCTFDNPESLLRPQMYATVAISVDQKRALAIPRKAVMRLAEFKVVFVEFADEGGYVKFKSVSVDVDEGESSPWLEVRRGLERGQKVVTNGGILLSQKL